jgi:hypothetical protein
MRGLSCRSGISLAEIGFTMPIREFTDSAGVAWRVWDTTPVAGAVYEQRLKTGWLTFESADRRKRLAPIPPGWEDASVERLELMCRAAEPARRSSSSSPTRDPDAPDSKS